jgi:hypothetical protein
MKATNNAALQRSLKPNYQRKHGAHERVSSDQTISRNEAPNGVRWWNLLKLNTLARSMRAGIKHIFVFKKEKP